MLFLLVYLLNKHKQIQHEITNINHNKHYTNTQPLKTLAID